MSEQNVYVVRRLVGTDPWDWNQMRRYATKEDAQKDIPNADWHEVELASGGSKTVAELDGFIYTMVEVL